MVSVISSLPLSETWAISSSGLRISRSAGASMSAAVTTPEPFFAMYTSISGDAPCRRTIRFLRLRMMSVTSSRTPGSVVNSWATPSIFTAVTAAPSSEDRSTRRSEFPKVWPKPRSSGSIAKTPRCSSASSWTILGTWNSIRLVRVATFFPSFSSDRARPAGTALLRVELDDERFLDGRVDLVALGPLENGSGETVMVRLEPGGDRGGQVRGLADERLDRAPLLQGDDVAGAHAVARDVDPASVHLEMPVTDELSRLRARAREAEPVDDVVEARLEHAQQVLARG